MEDRELVVEIKKAVKQILTDQELKNNVLQNGVKPRPTRHFFINYFRKPFIVKLFKVFSTDEGALIIILLFIFAVLIIGFVKV